jgi:hypothetical protein
MFSFHVSAFLQGKCLYIHTYLWPCMVSYPLFKGRRFVVCRHVSDKSVCSGWRWVAEHWSKVTTNQSLNVSAVMSSRQARAGFFNPTPTYFRIWSLYVLNFVTYNKPHFFSYRNRMSPISGGILRDIFLCMVLVYPRFVRVKRRPCVTRYPDAVNCSENFRRTATMSLAPLRISEHLSLNVSVPSVYKKPSPDMNFFLGESYFFSPLEIHPL